MQISMNRLTGVVTYNVSTLTEKDLKEAEKLQARMYKKYNSVQVVPNGIDGVKIICSN
jgi:hypothetical protein